MKGETDKNTIIVGDLNMLFTAIDRSSKQKINKEISALNDTLDQVDLIDTYRAFRARTPDHTLFSTAHKTLSRIDHMLGHKTSLNKFKETEIMPSIFSKHNALKL